jgi:hypothetical protein
LERFEKVTGPAEVDENNSKGISILGVEFLFASFSGEVAREDRPDRNNELLSVTLPLDGDGDCCGPVDPGCEFTWKGFRTELFSPIDFNFGTFFTLKSKLN